MAKISTATDEKVFQIKKWLGVNEAPEGDARLKVGEAAAMRNFKVTAGGALRKRPGSMNVAGLMSDYIVKVDTDTESELLFTFGVPNYELAMYPRVGTDSVGTPTVEGTAVSVTASNAEDYSGYYYEHEGAVYQFTRVEYLDGWGEVAVNGGSATRGSLKVIASGDWWDLGNGKSISGGDESVTTFSELSVIDNEIVLGGTETEQARAFSETVGWKTQNVGGFLFVDEKPYLYYGSRTVAVTPRYRWEEYNYALTTTTTSYYTDGSHTTVSYNINDTSAYTGYSSYTFDSSTGVFSNAGSRQTIGYGYGAGTVYTASGRTLTYTVCTVAGDAIVRYTYSKTSELNSSTETAYKVGDYLGHVYVADGEYPEADYLSYVGTVTQNGKTYIIMTNGTRYWAYIKSTTDTTPLYSIEYAWYGYPLTVGSGRYNWFFHPLHSVSNETVSAVRGIWSGFVNKTEVICAVCGGVLWQLDYTDGKWTKTACGTLNADTDTSMFGFEEKLYLLNGTDYKAWDGENLEDVTGYRPLVTTAVPPGGGGTTLESVNKLNGLRRCRFSPDGESVVFTLPESGIKSVDYVTNLVTGGSMSGWTADLTKGTITFSSAPEAGINTIEVGWTYPQNDSATVRGMRYAELYNGAQDSRVFLYGDGTNQCIYSGLDSNGQPRADYFPDLNVAAVGDANTPITSMIRHYNKLMAFKLDSTYSIYYDTLTLETGEVTAGFYITPVNRSIGNCAPGQAVLVDNRPRTLDGRSVIEWKSTSTSGTITGDQRNAQRISQRVDRTIRQFDLSTAKTFYDKYAHEYYVIGSDGTALVNNVDADAWFIYTDFGAKCLINYKDELYFGTADGYLRHVSEDYCSDNGEPIDALWESGSMAFDTDYKRKYSAMLWVGIKPENNGYLKVTAETDRKSDFAEYSFVTDDAADVLRMNRIKLKAKKFTYYKLILSNNTADTTATVVSADIRARGTGYVR